MNYLELLKHTSKKFNSIVCLGLDPVIDQFPPGKGTPGGRIVGFYEAILNRITQKGVFPAAVKPNYAFYAQYGIDGIEALVKIIAICREMDLPVILDYKRGDIGKTAAAYSREAFEFFNADAVTLSPFMGYDSISPYLEQYPDKGCYILNKTSNKSSGDFQDLEIDGKPLFLYVSQKIVEWYQPGIGAVVGATYPEQLDAIVKVYGDSGKEVPLLIPGIGAQGGSVKEVITVLKKSKDIGIHRINSSSAINYAYKKYTDLDFADASVQALKELNTEIQEAIGQR